MKVDRNTIEALAHSVASVTHAIESDDKFLHELVDDLRYLYQLAAEDLKEQGISLSNESWCVLKHLCASWVNDLESYAKRKRERHSTETLKKIIDAKGELIRKLVEHYEAKEMRKRAEKEKK